MVRQTVNDVTYHAKRKTRYENDCIENEWKEVTNNTNNWDSNRTVMPCGSVLHPCMCM